MDDITECGGPPQHEEGYIATLLSKPASYSPALFSVPVKIREHAYQSFKVAYGTGKVQRLCSYSTLAGAVKVRLRYGESTQKVRHTYG